MTGPPPILQLLAFLAVLVAINRFAPGLVQAVLVLVGLYLAISHPDKVRSLAGRAVGGLGGLYTRR